MLKRITVRFISVGSAHYHHPNPYRHQNSIHETADIYNLKHLDSPSVQSLQNIFSITKPSTTHFDSTVTQFVHKTPSTSAISSSNYKAPITYASLCHIDDLSSHRHSSILKDSSKEKDLNHQSKSLDRTVSTQLINLNTETEKRAPIEVRVRCIFLRVGEIDTLNERYTSEIFFEASWFATDPKIDTKYEPQAGHFNPQLAVLNNIGDSLRHEVRKRKCSNQNESIVVFFFNVEMVFSEQNK